MAAFHLSKWYLDCVTDAGEVSILYTGKLRWGAIRLNYSSRLEAGKNAISERHSFRAVQQPSVSGDSLTWKCKPLRLDCEWKSGSGELRETIFASADGDISWHCQIPGAVCRISEHTGWGYAEHLEMTIPPWKLPIRTLRWGRFISCRESVVWIDCRGEFARTLVYRNGVPARVRSIGDGRIDFEDGSQLDLDRSLAIREGPLGLAPFSRAPGIRGSLPGRLLAITECKWRSRGRLLESHGPAAEGWAIHERVEWPE